MAPEGRDDVALWRRAVDTALDRLDVRLVTTGGRQLTVFPDDRWLVSYPRSGNTWVRFLLTNLLDSIESATFATIEECTPDIYLHGDRELRKESRPRLLKSHEHFDARYGRVAYIVRDPRDVAVSYFRFLVKIRRLADSFSLDDFVERFIGSGWDTFGTWGSHVGGWLGGRENDSSFLLIRYEDIHAEPTRRLLELAAFLGITATEADAERAVAVSSADRVRSLEANSPELNRTRSDISFVGAATVGTSRFILTEAQRTAIAAAWPTTFARLGYEAS